MDECTQPSAGPTQVITLEAALAAHQASEERFRLVADFTYDWELWEDPEGHLVYVSPSCARITGYEADEFLQDPGLLTRLVHPEDRPRFAEHRRHERVDPSAQDLEFRIVARDGQERWIGHVCQRVYGAGGTWQGWRGSNRDITAQKLAERERERQHHGLQVLLRASEKMMAETTLDGLLGQIVQAARELTGARVACAGHGLRGDRFAASATSHDDAGPRSHLARTLAPPWNRVYLDLLRDTPCRRLAPTGLWHGEDGGEMPGELLAARLVGTDGTATGVVVAAHRAEGGFYDEDEALFAQLAALASLALQHAETRLGLEREAASLEQAYAEMEVVEEELRQQNDELLLAQEWLDESRGRLASVLNSITDGYYSLDAEWRFAEANHVAEQHFGRPRAELLGQNVWHLTGTVPGSHVHRQFLVARTEGRPIHFEARSDIRAGYWAEMHLYPRSDGLEVYFRDISDRKNAEAALRDSEQRMRLLFDGMTEGFALHEIICDAQGRPCDYRFLAVNPAFEELTGLRKDDLLGKTVLEVLPAVEPFWIETYGQVALSGEPIHFEQFSAVMGRDYAVSAYRPAENQFACIFLDITDRKQAEAEQQRLLEENRRQAEELDTVFESLTDAVVVYGAGGTLLKANRAALDLMKVPDAEIVGRRLADNVQRFATRRPDGRPVRPETLPAIRALDGETVKDERLIFTDNLGHDLSFLVSAAPLTAGPDGAVVGSVAVWHNVTEVEQAQHERERLIAILEATPDMVSTASPDGRVLYFNGAARRILGIPQDAGLAGFDIPRGHTGWANDRILNEGIPTAMRDGLWQGQTAVLDREGREIPMSQTILAHRAPDGRVEYLSTVARDVSREQEILAQVQDARRRAEEQAAVLDTMLASIADSVVFYGPDATIQRANPAAHEMFRFPPGEEFASLAERVARNRPMREDGSFYAEEELPVMHALRGERVAGVVMATHLRPGPPTWLSVSAAPVYSPGSRLMGAIVSFTDITELRRARDELEQRVRERTAELVGTNAALQSEIATRRQVEAELRESDLRFRQLAENVDEVFWLVEPRHDRLLYVNPTFERLWGLPVEEAYRDTRVVLDSVHPDDRERIESVWQARGQEQDVEFRLVRPDGSVRWLRSRTFAIDRQQSSEERLAGIISDVTAQKEALAAMIQAERLSTASRLAASLAHEINNPLQSAIGCLDLAQEALEDGNDPGRFLRVISEALARASGVVVQLRALHRPSTPEEPQPVALDQLLDRVLILTRKKCLTQGVTTTCEVDPDLPTLSLMPDAMQQVFLNLVLNALDAMAQGGELHIHASPSRQPRGVSIRFADTGAGLAPEIRDHLFEPFRTTKAEGLGLGLFISHNIVQQHAGRMEARSEEGKGTVFTIWLPAPTRSSARENGDTPPD